MGVNMNKGQDTKQRIIAASNQLFYQQVYASTAISHIVEKTGLSKGNITYHFKSKKNILEHIVSKRIESIKGNFKSWEQKAQDPRKRLHLFCQSLVSEAENLSAYGCPMSTIIAEFSKNQADLYETVLPMFQMHKEWLSKQYQALGIDQGEADTKSLQLLAQVQGLTVITHTFKDTSFLRDEIKRIQAEIANL